MDYRSPPGTSGGTQVPLVNENPRLQSYYNSIESWLSYKLILGDTRHFGYWEHDTWWPFPLSRGLRKMEEKLAEALDLCPGAQVLDAGCGVGHVAIQMARKYGLRVKGIDVVDHHVAKAKRNIVAAGLSDGEVTCEKMDYHNLKHIKSESLDGIYTIETFVHATDPEGVLAGFFDLLKPGGRIAMFEYENRSGDQSSQGFFNVEISRGLEWINKHSAMHTNMSSFPGEYKKMLEGVGFDHVEIRDYSDNIRPMTRFFCLLAFVPFLFIRLFGLEKYFINTVAGVGSYIGSAHWGYMAISASKPAKLDGGK